MNPHETGNILYKKFFQQNVSLAFVHEVYFRCERVKRIPVMFDKKLTTAGARKTSFRIKENFQLEKITALSERAL